MIDLEKNVRYQTRKKRHIPNSGIRAQIPNTEMLCCARGDNEVPEIIVVTNPGDGGLMFAVHPKPSPVVRALDVAFSLCVTEGMEYVGAVHLLKDEVGETSHNAVFNSWHNFRKFCVECMIPP